MSNGFKNRYESHFHFRKCQKRVHQKPSTLQPKVSGPLRNHIFSSTKCFHKKPCTLDPKVGWPSMNRIFRPWKR
jgi:hypothetical protein